MPHKTVEHSYRDKDSGGRDGASAGKRRKSGNDARDTGGGRREYVPRRQGRHGHRSTAGEFRDSSLFLPMSRRDMEQRGWDELDVLLVSGDAYVDHPAFGVALLGRWLESHGYRVGIVAQPRWDTVEDIARMGRPRLFAGVTAGAVDSMLAHYTAFRKKRHDDAYTPGGKAGARPNRAVSVYASLVRRAFPGLPVLAGGIEASLRRVSHYDFWTDSLRRSLLPDARLDLIIYGMGESAILEIARRLEAACASNFVESADILPREELKAALAGIRGTARLIDMAELDALEGVSMEGGAHVEEIVRLPSHEEILARPVLLIQATLLLERQVHQMRARAVQALGGEGSSGRARGVLLEIPAAPLSTEELDALYALPFTRRPHPSYREKIPAVEMMLTSMTCHRGCGGGCSFCSLALHQGRRIASRSRESLMKEARAMASRRDFSGSISDVGGPSANMWRASCSLDPSRCRRPSCMVPSVCPGFTVDQRDHIGLLHEIREIPGVRHVRVASGVRFDLALKQEEALEAYAGEFTGGQLKVAPEHCAPDVLRLMRKPGMEEFERFLDAFRKYSREHGKEQYVVPYLMSAFPGCTDAHMRRLADWLAERHWSPRQVQCFIPTPGTVATAMFYAEADMEGRPLYVAKSDAERLRQHGILLGTTRNAGAEFDGKRKDRERPAQGWVERSRREQPGRKGPR